MSCIEQITKKFKWYKCLHNLMSTSPIYDQSGLTNSTSLVNLDILIQGSNPEQQESIDDDVSFLSSIQFKHLANKYFQDSDMYVAETHAASPPWDYDAIDKSIGNGSSHVNLPSSPPPETPSAPPKTPAAAAPKAETPSKPTNSLKCKFGPLETLKDINHSVQRVKVEMTEIQAKSKLDCEALCLAAEKERDLHQFEGECACRKHECFMIQKQIELVRLQNWAAQSPTAPAPKTFCLDPALFH